MGIKSFGGALSLSQWGYDVSVVVSDAGTADTLQESANRHAGFFKNIWVLDYKSGIPSGSTAVIVEMEDILKKNFMDINEYMKMILKSVGLLLCTVTATSLNKIDRNRFKVHEIGETYDNHIFVCIETK